MKPDLNYRVLEEKLKSMKRGSKLYELVTNEMKRRGNWKKRPRSDYSQDGHEKPLQ